MTQSISTLHLSELEASGDPASVVARALDDAFRRDGFVQVVGHGVPADLLARVHAETRRFFELPESRKLQCEMPSEGYGSGFIRFTPDEVVHNAFGEAVPSDWKEEFCAVPPWVRQTRELVHGATTVTVTPARWPDEPADFRSVWQEYQLAVDAVARRLMVLCCSVLGLDEHWTAATFDDHESRLFAMYYPQQDVQPEAGRTRSREHTDWFSITLIHSLDAVGGLQVLKSDGAWHDIPANPEAFVVNTGDLLERFSRGRWKAPLHRVANPASGAERLSLVYFYQPRFLAEPPVVETTLPGGVEFIECLGYALERMEEHRTLSSLG